MNPVADSSAAGTIEILSDVRAVDFEDTWYDVADADHFWMEWRFRELLRLFEHSGLSTSADFHVLEVGGGHGVVRSQLERSTSWRVDLTDLNMAALERGGPSRGRTLYYDIRDKASPFHDRYDAILLLDVLEHIDETLPFLRSLAWHLKPGGLLIVNVPALPAFYSAYDKVLGHHRRYTQESLRHECAAADLRCEIIRFWGFSLLPLLLARFLVMRRLSSDPRGRAEVARRGMMPPNAFFRRILRMLMHAELRICRDPWFGTSLMCAARKPKP